LCQQLIDSREVRNRALCQLGRKAPRTFGQVEVLGHALKNFIDGRR
jgi:hypothetical protein